MSHSANVYKNHTRMHATSHKQTQLFPAFDNEYMYDSPSSTQSQYTTLFTRQPLVNPPPGIVGHTLHPYRATTSTLSPTGNISHGLSQEGTTMASLSTYNQDIPSTYSAAGPGVFGTGTSVTRNGANGSQQYRLVSTQSEGGWTSPTPQRGTRGTLARSPLSDKRYLVDLNMNPNMGMPIRIRSVLEYEYKDPKNKSKSAMPTSTSGSGLALRTPCRPRPRPYVARHDGNHKLGHGVKGQNNTTSTSNLHCSPRSISIPREVMELAIGSPTPSPMPCYASPPRAPRAAHVEMFEEPLLFPSFEEDEEFGYTFTEREGDEMDLDAFHPRKPSLDLLTTSDVDNGMRQLAPPLTIVSTSNRLLHSQAGFSGSSTNAGMGLFGGNEDRNGNGLGLGLAFTFRS